MNHNDFRRDRSPESFAYDNSTPMVHAREMDNPYHADYFDSRSSHHNHGVPPILMAPQPPFVEGVPNPNHYPISQPRDHPRPLPQNYRTAIFHRDSYPSQSSPAHYMQRAGSPPYKILCITNLNQKVSDGPVKEALKCDFSRFGDISVSICHDNGERLAYIYFKNYEEAREARHTKTRTLFFDHPIEIEPIYEPARNSNLGSPVGSNLSPQMPPIQPPIYSPRRRSMSPSDYSPMPNVLVHERPSHPQQNLSMFAPHHHNSSPPPPEFNPQEPVQSLGPPHPHDGRYDYNDGGLHVYEQHPTMNQSSPPYGSIPHEPYRKSYNAYHPHQAINHPHHYYDRNPNQSIDSFGSAPYLASRDRYKRDHYYGDRRGPDISTRSPTNESHYVGDPRGLQPPHYREHSSGRATQSSSSRIPVEFGPHERHPSYRVSRPHYPPDPPARYLSREYRREKLGSDLHPSEIDDGRPSRVLLVNNIDAKKTDSDLREVFGPFGIIEDIEVKKVGVDTSSALIKFNSMDGAYKAKMAIHNRYIGICKCRIVYGQVSACRRLWIGGLSPTTTHSILEDECSKYGEITSLEYMSGRPYCYVEYESANQAQFAAHHMRTSLMPATERKIRIEFVDPNRSEKLMPKNDSSSHASSGPESKSRTTNDPINVDASPQSTGGLSGKKRSLSPSSNTHGEVVHPKKTYQSNDLPLAANTFKQERLIAAAAAKARTSSTTSSHTSEKARDNFTGNELNNNGDVDRFSTDISLSLSDIPTPPVQLLEAPDSEKLAQCVSIRDVVQCCAVSWPVKLALRNFNFPANVYMCSGRKQLLDGYLCDMPILSITQRWRLHPQPKLEEVKRRMQSGNFGILVMTARTQQTSTRVTQPGNSTDPSLCNGQHNGECNTQESQLSTLQAKPNLASDAEIVAKDSSSTSINTEFVQDKSNITSTPTQAGSSTPNSSTGSQSTRPLRNLISYLEQKDAAGVITLNTTLENCTADRTPGESSTKLFYTFPPGEFALNLINQKAPNVTTDALKEEFLLGVIVGGNIEGKI